MSAYMDSIMFYALSFFHFGYVLLLEHVSLIILALCLGPCLYFQMIHMIQIMSEMFELKYYFLQVLAHHLLLNIKPFPICCHFSKTQC